ncbi:MAG: NUDIX hydrolase [Patescibacteria group bacterium]|nr:NUDIX hydrolase [Patescibacteria group bacterium]
MDKELSKVGDTSTCPVAVIVKNGKVLMGLRHYGPGDWKEVSVWTIPGGRCEVGETVEVTLRREAEEETGINDLEVLEYLGEVSGAKAGDKVRIFLCQTSQEEQLVEPKKFSEWRWFGNDKFPENFINPAILEIIKRQLK